MKAFVKKILAVSLVISMILSNGLIITAADPEDGIITENETDVTNDVAGLENSTEEKPEIQEEAEGQQDSVNTTSEFVYEFTDMQVKVNLEKPESLPFGVELQAVPVTDQAGSDDPDTALQSYYDSFKALFDRQTEESQITMYEYLSYDIRFIKDGTVIVPQGKMTVSYYFNDGLILDHMQEGGTNVEIYFLDTQSSQDSVKLGTITDDKKSVTLNADGSAISEIYYETENSLQFAIGTSGVTEPEETTEEISAERKQEQMQADETTVSAAENFSEVQINWKNTAGGSQAQTTQSLNICLVDSEQNKITAEGNPFVLDYETKQKNPSKTVDVISSDIIANNTYAGSSLNGKVFQRAYVQLADGTKKQFTTLYLWKLATNNGWQVKGGDISTLNLTNEMTVYFEYVEVGELEQIDTLSTSSIIDLWAFDYNPDNYSEQILTKSGTGSLGGATLGLVKSQLADNGMPVSRSGVNLDRLFGEGKTSNKTAYKADHLFYKDSDGYYYYSSSNNYGYYNVETSNFEVYNWIATASYGYGNAFQRGNFYPFNPLASDSRIYPDYGTDNKGRQLHNLETGTGSKTKNNGFGMRMEFEFVQPQDGKVNGKDMVFEFTGDDDVFVFIDGKLVLDIGGSHGPIKGSVNFNTGVVMVGGKQYTTLKKALGLSSTTLEDWSSHSLKFFYTDRGGASNCEIKFNISAVPKDSVNIKKEITNINSGSFSDVDFCFKLYLEDEENGDIVYKNKTYALQKNEKYTLYDTDGATILDSESDTGADGIFHLKHGQMASFKEITRGKNYFIEEVDVSQNEYDEFSINNTQLSDENGEIIKHESDEGKFTIRSMPLLVGESALVTFQNTCEASNLKDLTIQKQMVDGQSSEDIYTMQVKIGDKLFNGTYFIYDGNSGTETAWENATDGIITLKAGQRIVIKKIPSKTSFEITEINLDPEQYYDPVYHVKDADHAGTDGYASGVLNIDRNAFVTVTNEYKYSKLTITKSINDLYAVNGDAIFTFEVICPDGSRLYKTFRFTEENASVKQSFTIDDLPFGTYEVRELNTMRYTCQGSTNRTAVLETQGGVTVEFTNYRTYESNFSHTDVVVNKFTVSEDGSIRNKSQDRLKSK